MKTNSIRTIIKTVFTTEYLTKWELLLIALLVGGLLIGLLVDYDRPPPEQSKKDTIATEIDLKL